jgi:hypothetical protein
MKKLYTQNTTAEMMQNGIKKNTTDGKIKVNFEKSPGVN